MTNQKKEEAREIIQMKLPSALGSRLRKFAAENDTSVTEVVIEALDTFFRNNRKNAEEKEWDKD